MFVIQSIDYDFELAALNALKFREWKTHKTEYIMFERHFYFDKSDIPIGSIDFVEWFAAKCGHPTKPPIDITFLGNLLNRRVFHTNKDIEDPLFIKERNRHKGKICGVYKPGELPEGEYIASEVLKSITSEWRVFYYNGIQDIRRYDGLYTDTFDLQTIKDIITEYNKQPDPCSAFVLDVAVCDKGTTPLEIHPFVSCGLYGFDSLHILSMMRDAYHWFIAKN